MEDPIIRPARPEDAELLSLLAFRSKAYWGYSAGFMAACRDELSYTPASIADPAFAFWLAEGASERAARDVEARPELLGFYAIERLDETAFELEALFVAPAHIGTGLGRRLMTHATDEVRRRGGKSLLIQSDPNAEAFYRAAGARRIDQKESASIPGRLLPVLVIEGISPGRAPDNA